MIWSGMYLHLTKPSGTFKTDTKLENSECKEVKSSTEPYQKPRANTRRVKSRTKDVALKRLFEQKPILPEGHFHENSNNQVLLYDILSFGMKGSAPVSMKNFGNVPLQPSVSCFPEKADTGLTHPAKEVAPFGLCVPEGGSCLGDMMCCGIAGKTRNHFDSSESVHDYFYPSDVTQIEAVPEIYTAESCVETPASVDENPVNDAADSSEVIKPDIFIGRPSLILSAQDIEQMDVHLLNDRFQGRKWQRLYSLADDGSNYQTLFHRVQNARPLIIVIQTLTNEMFGGFLDCELKPTSGFYGTGDCFLWRIEKKGSETFLSKFPWTGVDSFFVYCTNECFGMGGGNGRFGFVVNEDMDKGTTGPCQTFGNGPLCNSSEFKIENIEIWSFTYRNEQGNINVKFAV